jgi:hypothetical protein
MNNIPEYKDRLPQMMQGGKPERPEGTHMIPSGNNVSGQGMGQVGGQGMGQVGGQGMGQVSGQGMGQENDKDKSDVLILFYHEQSKPCQKLKEIIPKDKKIQMVDISRVNGLPSVITSIPALLINNKDVLLGKKVFDYFNKTDEMEYIQFGGKNNSTFGFSSINDGDDVESNSMFSSIDGPSISDGVPSWNEDDSEKNLDIEQYRKDRESSFKPIDRQ